MKSKLMKFPFPLIVAIAYIFIGVLAHKWHPTWVMFLAIPAYYGFVSAIGSSGEEKSTAQILKALPFPSIVIVIYLVMGFALHLWHPGWLIFLLIPLYYALIPMFSK